jgi:hypothetical protein
MKRVLPLIATEVRLLVRDWTVLVFAFVFPAMVMLILAGVFGSHATVGFSWRNPEHYYVAASIGLLAFFPLYLLGGRGPPRGAMTGPMHAISTSIPSPISGIVDPWLGLSGLGTELAELTAWAGLGVAAIVYLTRRTPG